MFRMKVFPNGLAVSLEFWPNPYNGEKCWRIFKWRGEQILYCETIHSKKMRNKRYLTLCALTAKERKCITK